MGCSHRVCRSYLASVTYLIVNFFVTQLLRENVFGTSRVGANGTCSSCRLSVCIMLKRSHSSRLVPAGTRVQGKYSNYATFEERLMMILGFRLG